MSVIKKQFHATGMPVDPCTLFTPARAAAVVGISHEEINQFIDRDLQIAELVDMRLVLIGAGQRYVTKDGLLAMVVLSTVARPFTLEHRRQIVLRALTNASTRSLSVEDGSVVIDLNSSHKRLQAGLASLSDVEAGVTVDPAVMSGEPCLAGTRTLVHSIAGLASAYGAAEVKNTYDWITDAEIDVAVRYAKAHPRRGRPARSAAAVFDKNAGKKRSTRTTILR